MPTQGEPDLRELVNHAHVLETLDALVDGPMTFSDLRSRVGTGRSELAAVLRMVRARGVLTRSGNGSWDTQPRGDELYLLTPLGRHVVEELSHFTVWAAIYGDGCVAAPPTPPGKQDPSG